MQNIHDPAGHLSCWCLVQGDWLLWHESLVILHERIRYHSREVHWHFEGTPSIDGNIKGLPQRHQWLPCYPTAFCLTFHVVSSISITCPSILINSRITLSSISQRGFIWQYECHLRYHLQWFECQQGGHFEYIAWHTKSTVIFQRGQHSEPRWEASQAVHYVECLVHTSAIIYKVHHGPHILWEYVVTAPDAHISLCWRVRTDTRSRPVVFRGTIRLLTSSSWAHIPPHQDWLSYLLSCNMMNSSDYFWVGMEIVWAWTACDQTPLRCCWHHSHERRRCSR